MKQSAYAHHQASNNGSMGSLLVHLQNHQLSDLKRKLICVHKSRKIKKRTLKSMHLIEREMNRIRYMEREREGDGRKGKIH